MLRSACPRAVAGLEALLRALRSSVAIHEESLVSHVLVSDRFDRRSLEEFRKNRQFSATMR
jgi:hypothetical protein